MLTRTKTQLFVIAIVTAGIVRAGGQETTLATDLKTGRESATVQADWSAFSLLAGIGAMSGESSFEIGGKAVTADGTVAHIHFPLSRLDYPLDVAVVYIGGNYRLSDRWEFKGRAGVNLTSDAGSVEDRDWGIFGDSRSLDIYSESDAELDAVLVDSVLRYRLIREERWSIAAGIGYAYQRFDFEKRDLVQTYPSLPPRVAPADHVPGKIADYEVEYSIPYIDAVWRLELNRDVGAEARLGFSPLVRARDKGDWRLRGKTFDGKCDGQAVIFSLNADVDFRNGWFMAATLDALAISADGTQKQYFDEYFGEIQQEIESRQAIMVFYIGRRF